MIFSCSHFFELTMKIVFLKLGSEKLLSIIIMFLSINRIIRLKLFFSKRIIRSSPREGKNSIHQITMNHSFPDKFNFPHDWWNFSGDEEKKKATLSIFLEDKRLGALSREWHTLGSLGADATWAFRRNARGNGFTRRVFERTWFLLQKFPRDFLENFWNFTILKMTEKIVKVKNQAIWKEWLRDNPPPLCNYKSH